MRKLGVVAAIGPAALAMAGCTTIGNIARSTVGLDERPLRTESTNSAHYLRDAELHARDHLNQSIQSLVSTPPRATPRALADEAEQYYYLGRLAMRSHCESFMQTLASVDSQTTFGRDLANNAFDTATVGATISHSPTLWATALSTLQTSFNSLSGSAERFLLMTDSVGALRERVLQKMDDSAGTPPLFETYRNSVTTAQALDLTRQAIEGVQRYGAPCTEGGIRLIIAEALTGPQIADLAQSERTDAFIEQIRALVNKHGQYAVSTHDLQLLYLYSQNRGATDADGTALLQQIRLALPYLPEFESQSGHSELNSLLYAIQQVATLEGPRLTSGTDQIKHDLIAAGQAASSSAAPAAPPRQ